MMTAHHPRYAYPPQAWPYVAAGAPGPQSYGQPYDWRHGPQAFAVPQGRYNNPIPAVGPPVLHQRGKPSAVAVLLLVLVVAAVSAAIGAATGLLVHSGGGDGGSVQRVAAKLLPSMVTLETRTNRQGEEGSGIVLTADGLVLTNNHVIAGQAGAFGGAGASPGGAAPARVVTLNDGRTGSFSVVGADPTSDIAVVRLQGVSGLHPITVGSSAHLNVGQGVVAVGSPLGLNGTVTSGIISALDRPVSTMGDPSNQNTVLDAIQTDAAINPGNSGGALVDMNGGLVGVNSAGAELGDSRGETGSIGLGFAIPVDQAKRIADQLIANGKATHASLGVQVSPDNHGQGAKVVTVTAGGPASSAGIPGGAVVTKADARVIGSSDALIAFVRSKSPGDKVTLAYNDPSGASKTTQVTLGTAPQ
jgi:putative serine protease PepD